MIREQLYEQPSETEFDAIHLFIFLGHFSFCKGIIHKHPLKKLDQQAVIKLQPFINH